MWEIFPLFPESASTVSGKVDALYVYLVAVSAFFSLLIFALVVASPRATGAGRGTSARRRSRACCASSCSGSACPSRS
jgi:hypothetical protein